MLQKDIPIHVDPPKLPEEQMKQVDLVTPVLRTMLNQVRQNSTPGERGDFSSEVTYQLGLLNTLNMQKDPKALPIELVIFQEMGIDPNTLPEDAQERTSLLEKAIGQTSQYHQIEGYFTSPQGGKSLGDRWRETH